MPVGYAGVDDLATHGQVPENEARLTRAKAWNRPGCGLDSDAGNAQRAAQDIARPDEQR